MTSHQLAIMLLKAPNLPISVETPDDRATPWPCPVHVVSADYEFIELRPCFKAAYPNAVVKEVE